MKTLSTDGKETYKSWEQEVHELFQISTESACENDKGSKQFVWSIFNAIIDS